MASRRIDTEIDRLYQLPPDEFTAARNALAKDAGADRAIIRALAKPPLAAWAVNQVYWKQREVYDALIDASNDLRKVHKAVLSGRHADIREAGRTHDAAVEAALKAAIAILRDPGHPATDATRQAIVTTLRALPSDDPPGRLTRTLQPGGFEMLAGLSITGTTARPGTDSHARPRGKAQVQRLRDAASAVDKTPAPAKAHAPSAPRAAGRTKAEERQAAQAEAAQARAAREAAARAVREAEQRVRREQFEAARLTRDASRAEKDADAAREALQAAEQAVERAEADAASAARERDAAVERAKESARALDEVRAAARKL